MIKAARFIPALDHFSWDLLVRQRTGLAKAALAYFSDRGQGMFGTDLFRPCSDRLTEGDAGHVAKESPHQEAGGGRVPRWEAAGGAGRPAVVEQAQAAARR
jgi:hypothetical protein